ncbi:hypothetical protein MRX96_056923 [Rhipicephalus microplus]
MGDRIGFGTGQLDFEELNRSSSGVNTSGPCSATGVAGDDGGSIFTPTCDIFDQLPRWNYLLWHVGLQLRELQRPGRLSLVRVLYSSAGGRMLQARSRHARFLVYVLLVHHRCVESLHLDDTLFEGSGLGEYRERIVSPLRKNASLRTLILGSIFCEYKSIREELFGAIATLKNLCELTILGSAAAPSAVLDAVCALLAHTTSLVTLKIPSLAYDEAGATRLVAALRGNKTVQNVSLHGSILHSYAQNGVSSFAHFMANSAQLTSLSLEGVQTDPESTFQDVKWIVAPFHIRENLQSLCLTGFLLNAQCACLFAALVSAKKGCLKRLDLGGCQWIPKSRRERPVDGGATDVQGSAISVIAHQRCHWIESFDKSARVHLSFLALAVQGLEPEQLRPLFDTAITVKSLKTMSLSGVPLGKLKALCRVLREAGMTGIVRIEDSYIVDSTVLADLQEFPEALSKVAIRSSTERTPTAFEMAVRLACSCYLITELNLRLAQRILADVPTFRTLCNYLSTANSLRSLSLTGCGNPDLGRTLRSAGRPYSLLLQMIFKNTTVRALRLNRFHLGEENLRLFVAGVVASKSLCELAFASWDPAENVTFVRMLASKFRANKTITLLRLMALRTV